LENHVIPEVRPASPLDLPLVFRLERAYIEDFEPELLRGWQGAIDRHLEQWVSNLTRMHMVEMAGQVVGYYFWEVKRKHAVLSTINVLPYYRRQGVGALLLKHFESHALNSGMALLTLGVLEDNPAKRLYETAGYVFVRREGDYRYYEKSIDGGLSNITEEKRSS
jgi:ribosomal protein S18 acetylase RimI-like enzyme